MAKRGQRRGSSGKLRPNKPHHAAPVTVRYADGTSRVVRPSLFDPNPKRRGKVDGWRAREHTREWTTPEEFQMVEQSMRKQIF